MWIICNILYYLDTYVFIICTWCIYYLCVCVCGCVCVCVQATMALDYRIIDKHVRRHLQSGGAQFTHVQRPETTDISRHPYNGGVRVTGWVGGRSKQSFDCMCACLCMCRCLCLCLCLCLHSAPVLAKNKNKFEMFDLVPGQRFPRCVCCVCQFMKFPS